MTMVAGLERGGGRALETVVRAKQSKANPVDNNEAHASDGTRSAWREVDKHRHLPSFASLLYLIPLTSLEGVDL